MGKHQTLSRQGSQPTGEADSACTPGTHGLGPLVAGGGLPGYFFCGPVCTSTGRAGCVASHLLQPEVRPASTWARICASSALARSRNAVACSHCSLVGGGVLCSMKAIVASK